MFAFVGQVERKSRGREGFQEIEVTESIGRLAKWSAEPTDVSSAIEAAVTAVDQALNGRPGPVVLSLAEDLLDEEVPAGMAPHLSRVPPPRPTDDEVRDVLRLLAGAERPVILAGAGVLRARTSNDLIRLAELLRVPVIASWRRGDVISNDHPLYLGMTGYGSPPTVRARLEAADAILVIGTPARRDHDVRLVDPGRRHALGARRHRARTGRRRDRARGDDDHLGCPAVPARGRGSPRDARRPRRRQRRRPIGAQRRGSRRLGGRDRHRWPRLERPGRPSRARS